MAPQYIGSLPDKDTAAVMAYIDEARAAGAQHLTLDDLLMVLVTTGLTFYEMARVESGATSEDIAFIERLAGL